MSDANLCEAPTSAEMLVDYYNAMVEPEPFMLRVGDDFIRHQKMLRESILEAVGLSSLPERLPLDVDQSEPLKHEWADIRAVSYQLWPDVRARALLYMPAEFRESPAPAMLCPVGHWEDGNAHPDVQARCLNFARLGYVVICTTQHHYEDLAVGVSHQTTMIWNNMRALDLLESLSEIDRDRIGCAGCSGGGLQTQMVTALDGRIKVATMVGITCDYREIMFPYKAHCVCNHWPGAMRLTDQPEITALALPRPIQILTMDDWTQHFKRDNLAQIQSLYEANGVWDRVDHQYWPTPHTYEDAKRERTYWWIERWLRGADTLEPLPEPETQTYPPEVILELVDRLSPTEVDKRDAGMEGISTSFPIGQRLTDLSNAKFSDEQRQILRDLLGQDAELERTEVARRGESEDYEGLKLERAAFPSEGPIVVPTFLLQNGNESVSKICIFCDDRPGEERLTAPEVVQAASEGVLVVLPDVRFTGALSLDQLRGKAKAHASFSIASPSEEKPDGDYLQAWTRNSILWGRPLPGMTATDIRAVIDGVLESLGQPDCLVQIAARGEISAGALFAALLDERIRSADIDFEGRNFADGTLPLVPRIMQYGDVHFWMSLLTKMKTHYST